MDVWCFIVVIGNFNTKNLLPKLSIIMLTDLTNIPPDFTQETSLNGKYLKGIPTALTNPDVNTGNANHTHTSDGDHGHAATVPSHTHSGTHSTDPGGTSSTGGNPVVSARVHTHIMSSSSLAVAEASTDGAHTHDTLTNDLEHRTITFFKKTNTVVQMSRKSLPQNMTFFYSKTGTLPAGLLENLAYQGKHFKGNATPGTNVGTDNLHQHNNLVHNHPYDISAHEHTFSFAATNAPDVFGVDGGTGSHPVPTHGHAAGTAATINKSSTPVTSGSSTAHQHDDISHEPLSKSLRLMESNVVQMSRTGAPKNCIFLWLDLISIITALPGWQVSDGTNDTIDLLGHYPKGNSTPAVVTGTSTHTHSEDTASHPHSSPSTIGHTHSPSGISAATIDFTSINPTGSGSTKSRPHAHNVSTVGSQAAQTITITSSASNHDHGSISNDPDSKTVAFIERIDA